VSNLEDDPIVTFEDSAGNTISNDPRFHAMKTLEAAGISFTTPKPQPKVAKTAKPVANPLPTPPIIASPEVTEEETSDEDADLEEDNDEVTEEEVEDYSGLKGKELTALAKQRGVDIIGLTTAGEVRAALIAADAAATEE